MAARLQARIQALVAVCVVLAAAACAGDEHLPPGDELGPGGVGHSGESAGTEVDGGSTDAADAGDGAGEETCTEQGGSCLSDPDDPTMPAFCEAMELVEIVGACPDVDRACCAPAAAGLCEEAGGQCLASPSGGGAPLDCADFGLVHIAAPCASVDLICCG